MNDTTKMRIASHLFASVILFSLLFITSLVQANPSVDATGIYAEGESPLFRLGVVTDRGFKSAEDLLNSQQNKSIHMQVLADKIYARRLHRFWQEGAAINSDPQLIKLHAEHMVSYRALTDFALCKDDVLVIRSETPNSTIVELNGIALGDIKSAEFFEILLSAIVGPVPKSVEVKNKILSANRLNQELSDSRLFALNVASVETTKRLVDSMNAERKAKQIASKKQRARAALSVKRAEADASADKKGDPLNTDDDLSPKVVLAEQAKRSDLKKVRSTMLLDSIDDLDKRVNESEVSVASLVSSEATKASKTGATIDDLERLFGSENPSSNMPAEDAGLLTAY